MFEHLNIARNVVVGSLSSSFAPSGNYWLPLPQLLIAPFTWNAFLLNTGLAESIPSMLAYLVTSLYVFRTVRALTHNSKLSYLGSLIFILNPAVLFIQSTLVGMMLSIAMLVIISYYMLAWSLSGKSGDLLSAAGSICLATLISYDAWAYLIVLLALIPVIGLIRRQKHEQITSNLLIFSILGGFGILLCILWCWNRFGDPLYYIHAGAVSTMNFAQLALPNRLSTFYGLGQTLIFYGQMALVTLGIALVAIAALSMFVLVVCRFSKPA
jgi:hypothetical protein